MEDIRVIESTLLPSLKNIVLIESALSERRTLRLRDVLMKRVEQGVPLEMLDLGNCLATNRAIELLSEIVVDVLRPEEFPESGTKSFNVALWGWWPLHPRRRFWSRRR